LRQNKTRHYVIAGGKQSRSAGSLKAALEGEEIPRGLFLFYDRVRWGQDTDKSQTGDKKLYRGKKHRGFGTNVGSRHSQPGTADTDAFLESLRHRPAQTKEIQKSGNNARYANGREGYSALLWWTFRLPGRHRTRERFDQDDSKKEKAAKGRRKVNGERMGKPSYSSGKGLGSKRMILTN